MNRKNFISLLGLSSLNFFNAKAMYNSNTSPEIFYFKDDGKIPNSRYPLLIFHDAFTKTGSDSSGFYEKEFAKNNWTNSWVNGVYPFHHYHSTSHEVLGIYSGSALLHLGGENGKQLTVKAGDVIVIPAGVGHKKISSDDAFGVVGAYPDGRSWDLLRGELGERPKADENIAAIPFPSTAPLNVEGGLHKFWRK